MLTPKRLETLLETFAGLRIGVVGDFFLDAYFDCDASLNEKSLETGRTCYQVVRTRHQAGAADFLSHQKFRIPTDQVEKGLSYGKPKQGRKVERV